MRLPQSLPALLMMALIAGCGGGGSVNSKDAPVPPPTATPENTIGDAANFTPNEFLLFVNEHHSLGAGGYEVVVGTSGEAEVGTFDLRMVSGDGSAATSNGSWSAATGGGRDSPSHAGNPRFPVELRHAGGLRVEVESQRDAVIFLVRGGQVLTRSDSLQGGGREVLDLLPSQINSAEFADAYYAAVDPQSLRATLGGWKAANGFGGGGANSVINATFRDAKDLGYGRDMYVFRRFEDCGIAIFEDNYVVQIEPADASTYGRMNLDAAIERDQRFLKGTNAIEFGPLPDGDCGDPTKWVVSFYTFSPPDQSGEQVRLTEVDFDGRGIKFMPGICVVCHGGTLEPPRRGEAAMPPLLSDVTLKSSTFNVLNPASLEFSSTEGFRFEDQQDRIRQINDIVREVYEIQGNRLDTAEDVANWSPVFALEWRDGLMTPPVVQNSTFVPEGWRLSPTTAPPRPRPADVETLYRQVIEPYCIGCHSTRGTQVGEANSANAVNFSSWEKFDAYREDTLDYVFRRGKMPLSLIGYAKFWEDPVAPRLLADAVGLPNEFRASPAGQPLEAGRAVARAGADRIVFFPPGAERTIELDASASYFSTGFNWSVVGSPTGAAHSLENASAAVARLTVSALPLNAAGEPEGTYRLRLVTSNERGSSDPAEVAVTLTSEMLDDRATVFAASPGQQASISVVELLQDAGCVSCHSSGAGGNLTGIPVYFSEGSYPQDDLGAFYDAVMARVDLADPENSLLLRKPTSQTLRHGGGQQLDVASPEYNRLLNWIRAGAPCGGNAAFCEFEGEEVAPDAPSELRVTSATYDRVGLSWRDNAVDELGFEIERAVKPVDTQELADLECQEAPLSSFVAIRLPQSPGFSVTHLDADAISPETTYCYRVRAWNGASGDRFSGYSNFVTVLTDPLPGPPAPVDLAVEQTGAPDGLRLSWSPGSTADPAAAAERFVILRRPASETDFDFETSVSATPGTTRYDFDDTGLTPDTSYVYVVRAVNQFSLTAETETTGATPPAPVPAAPTITSVLQVAGFADRLRVSWTPSASGAPAEHFLVIRSGGGSNFTSAPIMATDGTTSYQFVDTGLQAPVTYQYVIRAVAEFNQTADSLPVSGATPTPPAAPNVAVVAWSDTALALTWPHVTGATQYQVFRDSSPVAVATINVGTPLASYRHIDRSRAPNTQYTYVVRALNGFGQTANSAARAGTTVLAGSTLVTNSACTGCHGTDWNLPSPPFPGANKTPQGIRQAVIDGRMIILGGISDVNFNARARAVCVALTGSPALFTSCDQELPSP